MHDGWFDMPTACQSVFAYSASGDPDRVLGDPQHDVPIGEVANPSMVNRIRQQDSPQCAAFAVELDAASMDHKRGPHTPPTGVNLTGNSRFVALRLTSMAVRPQARK